MKCSVLYTDVLKHTTTWFFTHSESGMGSDMTNPTNKLVMGLFFLIVLLLTLIRDIESFHSPRDFISRHYRLQKPTLFIGYGNQLSWRSEEVIVKENEKNRLGCSKCRLMMSPRDNNLVAGIAEISMGFSVGVLYSEMSILSSGCGPMNFSDTLERICYEGVILFAGSSIFSRIAFQKDLVRLTEDYFPYLEPFTLAQVRFAEILSLLGVIGAFAALFLQIYNGEQLDGLSGINIEMCRALRDL